MKILRFACVVLAFTLGAHANAEKLSVAFDKKTGLVKVERINGNGRADVPQALLLGHLFSALRLYDWYYDNQSEAARFATFPNSKKLTVAKAVERRFQSQFARLKSTVAVLRKSRQAGNLATIGEQIAKLSATHEGGAGIRPINDALFPLLKELVTSKMQIELDDSSVALIFESYLREPPDLGFVKRTDKKSEFMKAGVTQEQWFDVMGFNPSFFALKENCPEEFKRRNGIALCPNLPVETMSIHQLDIFVDKIRFQNPKDDVALPTLAERGEVTGVISEGSGWFAENSDMQTHAAKLKPANTHGLHDMAGNLWEVLRDESPSSRIRRLDPSRPSSPRPDGKFRIAGGSWIDRVENVQRKASPALPESWTCYDVGFRLVRRPAK